MQESNTVFLMPCNNSVAKAVAILKPRCWILHRTSDIKWGQPARWAMLGGDCLGTGRCLGNILLLHQPGFQEEVTVSNSLRIWELPRGETLPPPLLLVSHCLRTSPSTKQALAAAPVFSASHWGMPAAPAASPLPCTGPSSLRFS